jgi:hypothetical protein
LPSASLKIGDKRGRAATDKTPDIKKNRRRSFGFRFVKSLFGDKSNAVPVEGESATITSPSGNHSVYNKDGSANFSGPDWKLQVLPLTLSASPSLRTAGKQKLEFSRGDSFALSKQDLWEGGLSSNGECVNYYFMLAAAPDDGKFSLKLNVHGLHGTYDKDSGYVIFQNVKDFPQVVYVPALLKQANEVTSSVPLVWSEADTTISVAVPESLSYPISLMYSIFNKIPTPAEVARGLERVDN